MKRSIIISLLTIAFITGTALCSFASTGIVTTDALRLRKDASTNASIIALLPMDEKVEILEETNGWYKVIAGEKEGYVSAEFVEIIEDIKTPVATEVEEETDTKENTNNEEDSKNDEQNENINNDENEVDINNEEKAENEQQTEKSNDEENNENQTENTNNEDYSENENTDNNENEESTEEKEDDKKVKVLQEDTKLYITPLINSIVINTIETETKIEVNSEVNGWSYVTADNIKGWVRTDKIEEKNEEEVENSSSQKTGYISANSFVNLREEPDSSSNSIARITRNTQIKVLKIDGDWAKVEYDGVIGYVVSRYISDKKVETTSRSSVNRTARYTNNSQGTDTHSQGNATGEEIVAFAKQFYGYKYVYGGSTPSGFDCSGFTTYVYKHFGYSLTRTAASQASNGRGVSKSEMQLGDIICFSNSKGSSNIGHVGIYIGDGKFIHAANSRKGVIISNVDGAGFYYVCARRII